MSDLTVVDARESSRWNEARQLVTEYMVMTMQEAGLAERVGERLPPSLSTEIEDLNHAYRPPGTVFLALERDEAIGCVGMQMRSQDEAEVKRLYVREEFRGGVGLLLMNALHEHAAAVGIGRLVLDVLPSRSRVIDWYAGLGYGPIDPYRSEITEMVYLGLNLSNAERDRA